MTTTRQDPHILLIRPPLCVPGRRAGYWTAVAAAFEAMPVHFHIHDAAKDFFDRVLIGGRHLMSDNDLTAGAGRRFTSPDHGSQEDLLQDWETINRALASASHAFAPCQFQRHGFAHPHLNSAQDVTAFAANAAANPFRMYADRHWQPVKPSVPPDLALICIGQPGEMGPAATLGTVWKRRWPRIPLRLLCPEPLVNMLNRTRPGKPSDQWPFKMLTDMARLAALMADMFSIDAVRGTANAGRFEIHNGLPLAAERMPELIQAALENKTRLVVWRDSGEDTRAVSSQLYAAVRQGLWNHLILTERSGAQIRQFAAANANIIHSCCHENRPLSAFSDPVYRYPPASPAYGRTKPLPGRPLWMVLRDPIPIEKSLALHGAKTLMRLRVSDDGQSLFQVGRHLTYHFKPPGELPAGYLDEIVRMVAAGGSVDTRFVRRNLERAYLIAYVEEEGVIVGNSSLKHPRKAYIDAVSRQSGIDLHHYLERGYTSVRPEYRGLGVGVKLLEGLTQRAGDHKIFSVIAESNVATQKMAMRNRTRRVATFFSQRAQKEMSVWIPEWMLPAGIALPPQPVLEIERSAEKDSS